MSSSEPLGIYWKHSTLAFIRIHVNTMLQFYLIRFWQKIFTVNWNVVTYAFPFIGFKISGLLKLMFIFKSKKGVYIIFRTNVIMRLRKRISSYLQLTDLYKGSLFHRGQRA